MEFGDTGITTSDVSSFAKTGSHLAKTLPGMVGQEGQDGENGAEAPEAKICETCNQPVTICPTCHQKIVTSQPTSGGMDSGAAVQTAGKAFDCCSKAFDCFGKVSGEEE